MSCQTCKGKGWIANTWSGTGFPLEKCSDCDGTGTSNTNKKISHGN